MEFDTKTAAEYASQKLASLLERATRDSAKVIERGDIPETVIYFDELRETVKALAAQTSALSKHIDSLSQEQIPTMFANANVKTIKIDNVGRVTVNARWSATMIDKDIGMRWLRETGNDGLIIETVNAQTLGAFAKDELSKGEKGTPLPDDLFKVSSTPYISITKA